MRKSLPWVAVAAAAIACVFLFCDWAPYQFASMTVYTGLALVLAGAVCAVFPLRFLGIRRRRTGLLTGLASVVLVFAALTWPARLSVVDQQKTELDNMMPRYHFCERHLSRVHAPAQQVMAAIQQTTFRDLSAYSALVQVRGAVLGQKVQTANGLDNMPILNVMSRPQSAFLPLSRNEHEIVMGMVGRPWADTRAPQIATAADFVGYWQPGSVKIAFNLRVNDAGNGWSLVSTETRVLGLDDSGRRTMARYWRLIVPGSGLIRRQWLNAIQERAEHAYRTPQA